MRPGSNLPHVKQRGDEPLAVFEFADEDESCVDAYASLQRQRRDQRLRREEDEGAFFAANGHAAEAATGGKWGLDVVAGDRP